MRTFAHKVAQAWCVLQETSHTTLFGIYYCVELLELKIILICYKLRAKFLFYEFLKHKVDQTLFVLHETWQTKLFGIYYCVNFVRIENHSYMLEITC